MNLMWLDKIIAPVSDFLFGWVKRSHERKMAEHHARLEVIKTHTDYDVAAQSERANTWLDEVYGVWLLGVLTYAMFDDEALQQVQRFDELPDFIQWTFLMIVGALFGWRAILGPVLSRKAGVKMIGVGDVATEETDTKGKKK